MKIPNYIFWSVLALIAIFYITVGNDMKKNRFEALKPKVNVAADINGTN